MAKCQLHHNSPKLVNLVTSRGPSHSQQTIESYCPHPLKGHNHFATVLGIYPFSMEPSTEGNNWQGFEILLLAAVAEKIGFHLNFVNRIPIDLASDVILSHFSFSEIEFLTVLKVANGSALVAALRVPQTNMFPKVDFSVSVCHTCHLLRTRAPQVVYNSLLRRMTDKRMILKCT